MNKNELINELKQYGMGAIYKWFHELDESVQRELVLSALFVIGNNNLDDEYFEELENNLI